MNIPVNFRVCDLWRLVRWLSFALIQAHSKLFQTVAGHSRLCGVIFAGWRFDWPLVLDVVLLPVVLKAFALVGHHKSHLQYVEVILCRFLRLSPRPCHLLLAITTTHYIINQGKYQSELHEEGELTFLSGNCTSQNTSSTLLWITLTPLNNPCIFFIELSLQKLL